MSINTNHVTDTQTPTTGNLNVNSSLTLPKTSGSGIKVDPAAPTFGWCDLLGDITTRGAGANDPTWTTFVTNISAYQFDVNSECWITFHMPHDYAPGTNIFIHSHWAITTTSTANVTWGFDATYAKGFNQALFPATINTTVVQAGSGVANQHMIAETQLSVAGGSGTQLNTTNLEVDGLILMRVYLSANATGVDPFLFKCDVHYQSTGIATKNKSPDFWA